MLRTYRHYLIRAMYAFGVAGLGAATAVGALMQESLTAWAYIPALVLTFSALALVDLGLQVLPFIKSPRALTASFPDHEWTGVTSMKGSTAPVIAMGVVWATSGAGLAVLMLPDWLHSFTTSFFVSSTTGFLVTGWKRRAVETWARSIKVDSLTVTAAWHHYNGTVHYYINDTVYTAYPREELELEFERRGSSVLQAALQASELHDAFVELEARHAKYFKVLL